MAIQLAYPFDSEIIIVDLPNPLFENSEQLNIKRINKRTKGLITQLYRDPIWEEYTTLFYIIQALSESQVNDYKEFVNASYAKEIKLIDYEGTVWKGILIPAEITDQMRFCGFVIQFEFQGIKQ